ncbi:transposase [Rhodococcus sp. (in: high G+C Gram-positive bacteria)]|uniref:transposase n=1 Tax=Rhodococcus sp. TaxID=1831 RepID=UPI003B8A7187
MHQSGVAVADHHQFVLGSPTAETYEPAATGSVIEVGPNFVTVMTGIAYGPASLTVEIVDDEPAFDADQCVWDVVEEATVKVTKDFHVIALGGEKLPDFDKIAIRRGLYRFRVSGRGRDTNWDLSVDDPTEEYLVQVWRVNRPHGMVRLHKTDTAWDQDIVEHPTRNWWDPDPAADASMYLRYGYEQMAEWAKQEAIRWGGRPPSEKLSRCPQAVDLAGADRALADAITRAREPKLRLITVWAVRRALTIAGIADRDWIAPALDALEAGRPVPPPFGSSGQWWETLRDDPTIDTTVTEHGPPPAPLIAISAVRDAIDFDPLQGTFQSLHTAARTDGGDYASLIRDLRAAFFPKLMPADQYERWI